MAGCLVDLGLAVVGLVAGRGGILDIASIVLIVALLGFALASDVGTEVDDLLAVVFLTHDFFFLGLFVECDFKLGLGLHHIGQKHHGHGILDAKHLGNEEQVVNLSVGELVVGDDDLHGCLI